MPFLAALVLGLSLWLFAEIAVFQFVAQAIGIAGAILATLLTSLFGTTLLRRLGRTAQDTLAAMFSNSNGALGLRPEALQSGVAAALGAVLLILPGFLSDIVGLALIAPSLRHLQTVPAKPPTTDVVDLSPQDWRRIDEAEPH